MTISLREQSPKAPNLAHKARHSLPRHGDEGRILVPESVNGINIARLLNQRCGNYFTVIKFRPSLAKTGVWCRAHRHKAHRPVII